MLLVSFQVASYLLVSVEQRWPPKPEVTGQGIVSSETCHLILFLS